MKKEVKKKRRKKATTFADSEKRKSHKIGKRGEEWPFLSSFETPTVATLTDLPENGFVYSFLLDLTS